MIKVVTADEMKRVEAWAALRGASLEVFMQEAGKQVAEAAKKYGKKVVLLIGKGNKGGDAFVAGMHLQKWGCDVRCYRVFRSDECTPLNQKFGKQIPEATTFDADFFIDGLLGTGFTGKLEGKMAECVCMANQSGKPILSIDIPSGLDGNTGESSEHTISAAETVTLGLPKIGLFLKNGWNFVGKLSVKDFGLPPAAVAEAKPVAFIPRLEELHLPKIIRNQHKYSRGFVLGFGGSSALKGAMKLSGLAALHAGAGIVKMFTLEEIGPVANELICQVFDSKGWNEAYSKAEALFIGPGLGRTPAAKKWLETYAASIDKPCVFDGDALFFLTAFPKYSILTPHKGEMARLLQNSGIETEQEFVDAKQVHLVLKGAPTFILGPNKLPIIIPRGDPGMATAGSGDVLTGIIAALLAQKMDLAEAATLGCTLHALAGEAAAKDKTSYGYLASDLIDELPNALKEFRSL